MPSPSRHTSDAKAADPDTLASVFDTHSAALFRYAYRLLGNAAEAEDVVAETFTRWLTALRNGGGPSSYLRAYLYRIAHNLAMDHYRRRPVEPLESGSAIPQDSSPPHEAAVEESERADAVRRSLWRLTADQRQVILLKYYEGLSNDEVAATIGKPVGAVKSLQHRALDSLRRMMDPAPNAVEAAL